MKKSKLIILLLLWGAQSSVWAQENKTVSPPPSDATTGFTYNFDKAKNLIIERLTKPEVSNEDAQALISENTFPKIGKNEKIDSVFIDKLNSWIEKNPDLIIKAFKNRKDVVQQF